MRTLTNQQLEQIATWREAGKTFRWIGEQLGMSATAIRWRCLRLGADHPRGHTFAPSRMPMVVTRRGVTARRFTPDEDATILRLRAAGQSTPAIGRALGRRHQSIIARLLALGMNADRQERAL